MNTVRDFDFSIDLQAALLWQYNDATRLQRLVLAKQAWYDGNADLPFPYWFAGVFDLRTCGEDGLYVWSIILDVPLFVTIPPAPADYPAFGFEFFGLNFYGNPADPQGANFSSGGGGTSGLTVEQQRMLLQVRYFQLTTNGSVTEINRMLAYVFGAGVAWVVDNLDMTMTYLFNGGVPSALVNALQVLDILPRPAGVGLKVAASELFSFGFEFFGLNFYGDPADPQGANFHRGELA